MVRAKVVLVGAPAVGKTSLVRRFVHQVFTDRYRSTLGVKVDRKSVAVGDHVVHLLLWDTHGEGDGLVVPESYLGGAVAAIAVFDATRPDTLEMAESLVERVHSVSPEAHVIFVANKSDLIAAPQAVGLGSTAMLTSAKTGDGVDEMFGGLAQRLTA